MFAEDMAQFWAIYQIDLNASRSEPLFNSPIAVFSIEYDARGMYDRLVNRFRLLTFVLTSHENGREGYSEVN